MAKALDPFVTADDQAGAERPDLLETLGDPGLDVEIAQSRNPFPESILERGCRVGAERGEAFDLGRRQCEPQLDKIIVDVDSQPADALTRRLCDLLGESFEAACVVPRSLVQVDPERREARLGIQARPLDVRRDGGDAAAPE